MFAPAGGILRPMTRWLGLLVAAAIVVFMVIALSRAPRVTCASLDPNACLAASRAIVADANSGRGIVRIGLVGYRGCFPGPVYCPLIPNEAVGSLNAVAGVEYADGSRAAFQVWALDSGGGPSVSPMQDDLVDYSIALVFPRQ